MNKTNCYGCSACSIVCPKECISMEINNNGFYRPSINTLKCIHCGLCEKVCPINQVNSKLLDETSLYSAYAKDKNIRNTSSSGGLAYIFEKKGIEENKLVCGVSYNDKSKEAEHIVVSNTRDLEYLKQSKYLQSISQNGFKEVINLIRKDSNKQATIIGTPCQISGLNNVLNMLKLRERVLLVDIFCHGVPSYLLWNKYLKEISKKMKAKKINVISFRDKKYSWHDYFMHINGGGADICLLKRI